MVTSIARSCALLLIFLAALAPAVRGVEAAPAAAGASRPNLVLLLTDDQRWDALGCAGHPIVRTPNIDALARGGIRFRNAFVTTPICAASRASLLTGLYERTHRYTFGTPPLIDRHTEISYPVRLKKAGYRTGFVGKFGVNVPKGAEGRMFDYFRPLNRNPYFKKQADGTERYVEDIAGDRAVEFLDGCKPGEPFCLSVSFNAPHAEDNDPRQYFWPPSVDHLYKDTLIPVPKTMSPEFFEAQPEFLKSSESRVRFNWRFNEPAKYQEMVRGYYRMISAVDQVIGRLREELERRGLAENTIVLFSSDNGYFLGERGFADKWYGYEYSLRVPLIVFDPRLDPPRRGRVLDPMALNVDVAPTLLDLAGVPVLAEMQGRSLLPLLRGDAPKDWRTDFFFEHLFERNNIPKSEGVRTERWTYIRWFDQTPLVEELYDHVADFDQTRNLVRDPRHADILVQLNKRTDQLRDRYGGPYKPHSRDN
jgi:arylsulfatase A-like enzyme